MAEEMAPARRKWFARTATTRKNGRVVRHENQDPQIPVPPSPMHAHENRNTRTGVKRRRSEDVSAIARDSIRCCRTTNCVESFILGHADFDTLRMEQEDFGRQSSAKGRLEWTRSAVPVKKPGKNKGSIRLIIVGYGVQPFFHSRRERQEKPGVFDGEEVGVS